MCLAVVALATHPRYALVVAANRDEYHARPAAPAHWWPDGILAGRDERASGTWLGSTREGRFALITNVREPGRNVAGAPSRGALVPRILRDPAGVRVASANAARDAARYNGFNVIAGDLAAAYYFSNRHDGVVGMQRGVFGVANAALDEPWPKVVHARDELTRWCARGDLDFAPVWAALADRRQATEAELPATGLAIERERVVSAAFIVDPVYGTRSSTLLAITHEGDATFIERSFDERGAQTREVTERYALRR
ncbi:MAG: NRDE family protein [Betaproteobacteria bacterium]